MLKLNHPDLAAWERQPVFGRKAWAIYATGPDAYAPDLAVVAYSRKMGQYAIEFRVDIPLKLSGDVMMAFAEFVKAAARERPTCFGMHPGDAVASVDSQCQGCGYAEECLTLTAKTSEVP